ncbi:hypothetical protein ACF0H5_001086 [Mactra antiquata]
MDKTKEERSELKEFGKLCEGAAIYCGIILGISALVLIGIAKVAMGVKYLNECDIQHLIPIYLIVSAIAPLIFSSLGFGNDENDKLCAICCSILGFIFTVIWQICGTVWIYPNYGKLIKYDFTPCTGNQTTDCTHGDCNQSLITFAVAMVTIDWIIVIVIVVGLGYLIYRDNRD